MADKEWTPLTAQESFNEGKAYSQANYGHFATSREDSSHLAGGGFFDTFRPLIYFRNLHHSVRSQKRHRLNIILGVLLALTTLILLGIGGFLVYKIYVVPYRAANSLEAAIRLHAEAAAQRVEKCRGIDWKRACDNMGAAGARRSLFEAEEEPYDAFEDFLLHSDDPSVTYDDNCLRVYRLDIDGGITFPYHSSQFLKAGGNQTMALFIQVSAFGYPCSAFLGLSISHSCV
jgi:hypothetical protein